MSASHPSSGPSAALDTLLPFVASDESSSVDATPESPALSPTPRRMAQRSLQKVSTKKKTPLDSELDTSPLIPMATPAPTASAKRDPAKVKALENALAMITKNYGEGSIMKLGAQKRMNVETLPSGSLALDMALGGGFAKGRVVEIYGPESSGKTTLALHAVANVQKMGGQAAFVDAEHALDPEYATRIGVDLNELLISQPDTGEQALEIVETLIRSGAVDIIVVDSVAALTPRAEIEGEMGGSLPGLHARLMSQALRKITAIASKSGTTLVFLNQLRMKIGVMFGNPETTTGGNALKFYASQRLDIRRTGKIEVGTGDNKSVIGSETRVKVIKNKVAPPFRQAEFEIRYNVGIDKISDLISTGVQLGVFAKSGAFITLGTQKYQGMEKARAALEADGALYDKLEKEVRAGMARVDGITGEIRPA